MKLGTLLILLTPLALVSCAKKSSSNSVQSFQEFSIVQNIPVTDKCNEKCTSLKKEFRYVVYVGKQIYCYWDEKKNETGFNFEQIANQLEARISNETSVQDYYMLLLEWAASFHDGHVNVMRDKVSPENFEFYSLNVRFELLAAGSNNEKLIIAKVGDDVLSLKVGTEVTKIDGKPWQELIQDAVRYASGSTERMRRRHTARLLLPLILGMKKGFKDIHVEGIYKNNIVEEQVSRILTLSDGTLDSDPIATGVENVSAKIIAGNVGYLRIDEFNGTKLTNLLDQAMSRLALTEGLLIDVRLNGGGTQAGNRILAKLIEKKIVRYAAQVRNSDMLLAMSPELATTANFAAGDWSEIWNYSVEPTTGIKYKNPVVVLTSPTCFSACDTFVSAIREHKLGKIIGEPTGGGTGTPEVFTLPESKLQFRYSVQKGYTAVSHQLIEGHGTDVDLEILPTVQERASGKDKQLKKAVLYLKSLIAARSETNASSEAVADIEAPIDHRPLRSPLLDMDSEIKLSGMEN